MRESMTFPMTRQGVRNLDEVQGRVLPISGGPASQPGVNTHSIERVGSAVAGLAVGLYGLTRGGLAGLGIAVLGGMLVNRGVSGHCSVYQALGVNTSEHGGSNSNAEYVYRVQ